MQYDPFLAEIERKAEAHLNGTLPGPYQDYYGNPEGQLRAAENLKCVLGQDKWDRLYINELTVRSPASGVVYWIQREPVINLVALTNSSAVWQMKGIQPPTIEVTTPLVARGSLWCVTLGGPWTMTSFGEAKYRPPYPDLWLAQYLAITSGNDAAMMRVAAHHGVMQIPEKLRQSLTEVP